MSEWGTRFLYFKDCAGATEATPVISIPTVLSEMPEDPLILHHPPAPRGPERLLTLYHPKLCQQRDCLQSPSRLFSPTCTAWGLEMGGGVSAWSLPSAHKWKFLCPLRASTLAPCVKYRWA